MTNEQICILYEQGTSVMELSDLFNMPIDVIKMALASSSPKFNKEIKKDNTLFGEDVKTEASLVMRNLMYAKDCPNVQYRAAKYIIDEESGRHENNPLKGTLTNVNLVNVHFHQARKAIEKAKQKATIEVESSKINSQELQCA